MPKCPYCNDEMYEDEELDAYVCDPCEVVIEKYDLEEVE